MDPSSTLLLFALFYATEKVIGYAGGKIADVMSQPIWEALENKARWLAKNDDTGKRWRAFKHAFDQAKTHFVETAPYPEMARRVRDVLDTTDSKQVDGALVEQLAAELEKASLLTEKPNTEAMTTLCLAIMAQRGGPTPARADVADTLAHFIEVFQNQLFTQSAYREWMLQQAKWQELHQRRADTRARYLAQVIDCHQNLDFVGIPELKDRQTLHVEDVFINLQTETETSKEVYEIEEVLRTSMADKQVTVRRMWGGTPRLGEIIKRRLSVNQALHEYNRLVILGDPGAGKTTLLKHVTLAFARQQSERLSLANEERLPIFIRLYDYVAKRASRNGDYSLVDYLYTQAHESLLLDLEPGFFEEELGRGRCCVCLDGLDELGGAGLRREVTAAVAALVNRYPFNRYLVTSRVVGYDEAPLDRGDFVHHTILPFSDDDIECFVQKWYQAREPDQALARQQSKHLTGTIMRESRIKTLAANPLMLTIIALVHRIEAELPYERVKLYDKCVTALVETWEKVKRIKIEDRERPYYRKRRQLLEQLAFWLHTQPLEGVSGAGQAREVEEGDLKAWLARFLLEDPNLKLDKRSAWQEAEDFITMAKSRTGLLVERGDGVYAFAHLTFQEYLAAAHLKYEYIHSIDEIWAVIQPHLHNPHWREVILLLLGSLNEFRKHPTELVRRIYESTDEYEDVLHRHLYLAARALADRVEVDTALHDEIVNRLLEIAQRDWLGGEDAFATLATLKNDGRIAADLLTLACEDEAIVGVRSLAAQTLGMLGYVDDSVLSGLLALARDNKVNDEIRIFAAKALGQLGQIDDATDLLLELASDNKAADWVRSSAVQILGQLEQTDKAIEQFLALMRDNKTRTGVKIFVAQALGQLGQAKAAANLLSSLVCDDKQGLLMQRIAIDFLGELGYVDEATLSTLLALARDTTVKGEIRGSAAKALGQWGQIDDAANLLLELAYDPTVDDWVREEAVQVLGQLSQPNAIIDLLLKLAYPDPADDGTRSHTLKPLAPLAQVNDTALSALLRLTRDKTVKNWIRSNAVQILGLLGRTDEAILSGLLALACDNTVNSEIRSHSIRALGQLGCPADNVLSCLLDVARHSAVNVGVRSIAVSALGQLGQTDKTILSGLLALAHDRKEDGGVRSAAYQSLKALLGGG